ncbi:hypothetical protein V8C37DRAFT_287148 [Trichoderma ceciliae]
MYLRVDVAGARFENVLFFFFLFFFCINQYARHQSHSHTFYANNFSRPLSRMSRRKNQSRLFVSYLYCLAPSGSRQHPHLPRFFFFWFSFFLSRRSHLSIRIFAGTMYRTNIQKKQPVLSQLRLKRLAHGTIVKQGKGK